MFSSKLLEGLILECGSVLLFVLLSGLLLEDVSQSLV
jgi:hypothetical protein